MIFCDENSRQKKEIKRLVFQLKKKQRWPAGSES